LELRHFFMLTPISLSKVSTARTPSPGTGVRSTPQDALELHLQAKLLLGGNPLAATLAFGAFAFGALGRGGRRRRRFAALGLHGLDGLRGGRLLSGPQVLRLP
jgi:hypothetical protein